MKKILSRCDKFILAFLIIYSLLGLVMILSASSVSTVLRYNQYPYYFFVRQLAFLSISTLGGLALICFTTKKYKYVSVFYVLLVIISLIGLFTYGKITNHAQSWYAFGPIRIQPSEFAKTALIVYMAVFYEKLVTKKIKNIYAYLIPLALTALFALLVLLQPDLGSAVIIAGIGMGIFISVPIIKNNISKILKIFGVLFAIIAVIFLYSDSSFLNSTQLTRLNFKNPCSRYREETGYQVCNGYIAIHNGGLFGVGMGNSTQKYLYLPESHTDFIFPIIVEELGLIVGIVIVCGYAFILFRILKIAKESFSLQNSILCYGAFIYLSAHILINLAGILALVPLTGVPLPLLSYGGSSTTNFVLILFVILRVSAENNISKNRSELKKITN